MNEISEQAASPGNPASLDIERLYDARFATHSYGDTPLGHSRREPESADSGAVDL